MACMKDTRKSSAKIRKETPEVAPETVFNPQQPPKEKKASAISKLFHKKTPKEGELKRETVFNPDTDEPFENKVNTTIQAKRIQAERKDQRKLLPEGHRGLLNVFVLTEETRQGTGGRYKTKDGVEIDVIGVHTVAKETTTKTHTTGGSANVSVFGCGAGGSVPGSTTGRTMELPAGKVQWSVTVHNKTKHTVQFVQDRAIGEVVSFPSDIDVDNLAVQSKDRKITGVGFTVLENDEVVGWYQLSSTPTDPLSTSAPKEYVGFEAKYLLDWHTALHD
eukprot:TRINITY_DN88350_c0_g1_i1.p2 TRINITY_DN88350_c0_g1~~TRINITY_DN88350_c0_g1_i1.p2  ORF type:complete len:277 (-),score=20.57 TRINITY_DN88350_c0_g1_i1:82-912(-)